MGAASVVFAEARESQSSLISRAEFLAAEPVKPKGELSTLKITFGDSVSDFIKARVEGLTSKVQQT